MIVIACLSVVASVVDARCGRLPNILLGFLALFASFFQLLRLTGAPLAWAPWMAATSRAVEPPLACLLMALALALLLAVPELWRRSRGKGEGLGMGDVKLAFAWTLVLGSWGVLALGLASLTGALWGKARGRATFALGPWISAWALVAAALLAL